MAPESHSGGCLCGAVRYEVVGPLRQIVACHCTQCRKTSGHYVAATACSRAALRVTGEPRWFESSPGVRRGFCGTCGSNLFWENAAEAHISIWAGGLDGPTGLRIAKNIFTEFKGDYYDPPLIDGAESDAP